MLAFPMSIHHFVLSTSHFSFSESHQQFSVLNFSIVLPQSITFLSYTCLMIWSSFIQPLCTTKPLQCISFIPVTHIFNQYSHSTNSFCSSIPHNSMTSCNLIMFILFQAASTSFFLYPLSIHFVGRFIFWLFSNQEKIIFLKLLYIHFCLFHFFLFLPCLFSPKILPPPFSFEFQSSYCVISAGPFATQNEL